MVWDRERSTLVNGPPRYSNPEKPPIYLLSVRYAPGNGPGVGNITGYVPGPIPTLPIRPGKYGDKGREQMKGLGTSRDQIPTGRGQVSVDGHHGPRGWCSA